MALEEAHFGRSVPLGVSSEHSRQQARSAADADVDVDILPEPLQYSPNGAALAGTLSGTQAADEEDLVVGRAASLPDLAGHLGEPVIAEEHMRALLPEPVVLLCYSSPSGAALEVDP